MDELENTSWIRRAKYSHTICHRLDATSSRLQSVAPLTQLNRTSSSVKSRPPPEATLNVVQVQRNPTTNRQRAVSPHLETKLSDTFKEARSLQRRFSTPHPQRKESDKGITQKLTKKSSFPRNYSPLKHRRKDSAWAKYFENDSGKVTSVVECVDDHPIDRSQLFLGLRFAHGGNSQLYHATYKGEKVAMKIIRIPDGEENYELGSRLEKQFTNEVCFLSRLHHQNIIKFIAACRAPPVFCILAEYLPNGSLRAYLHKLELEHNILPLEKVILMALDIARGMEYIHSQRIIHRDLKPENVLITEDYHLKVADFGIACEEANCDLLADDPGTYRWMAPEMIKRKHYGRKVDVYGFGLILWEFVAGTVPYGSLMPVQVAFAVVDKNLRPVIPTECPPAMKALIEHCWSLQPDKRPEFWQIVKVLEEFETSYARDGTLNLLENLLGHSQDHKKGLSHWIHKLGHNHHHHQTTSTSPKPKFS